MKGKTKGKTKRKTKKILIMAYEINVHTLRKTVRDIISKKTIIGGMKIAKIQFQQLKQKREDSAMIDLLTKTVHAFNIFKYGRQKLSTNKIKESEKDFCIFILPEFFFSIVNNSELEPYTKSEFYSVLDYCMSESKKYPKWLFVLGTIYWGDMILKNQKKKSFVVHNTACIVSNGELVHTYLKQIPSRSDGVGDNYWDGYPDINIDKIQNRRLNVLSGYTELRARMRRDGLDSNFFKYKDVYFGIEICYDHGIGVLRYNIKKGYGKKPDIHILVAYGHKKDEKYIMSRIGGIFIRCDGAFAKRNETHSEVCKVNGGSKKQIFLPRREIKITNIKGIEINFDHYPCDEIIQRMIKDSSNNKNKDIPKIKLYECDV